MRYILLVPGPVNISDGVRKAATATALYHHEPEYINLLNRVRNGLAGVYHCDPDLWTSVLLSGSGTSALEAMLSSLVPRQAKLLAIGEGQSGGRINRIAEIHAIDVKVHCTEQLEAIDFAQVEAELSAGKFTHVAAVHHEASCGRLNDVMRLADLCEQHGAELLLETGSSFGAEEIPFASPALLACSATASKCLQGIPGLCFVICRKSALKNAVEPPRSLSLDLSLWSGSPNEKGTPFTLPVNGLLALDTALAELADQGGWKARHARYLNLASQVRRALSKLGIAPLLAAGESSSALGVYRLPQGKTFEEIHDSLKQRGFVIDAGLETGMFRIATMGDISHYDMERLLSALSAAFSV